jgi:hypothetical protein
VQQEAVLREKFQAELEELKTAITQDLILNFRESLSEKFIIEEQRINDSIE